ncbi:hypothetical protein FRC08_004354 [Ceratobasidium sp. 394]|nr:hypothetical protein FRC08_004354 [Ceratobasidium sp. 394]
MVEPIQFSQFRAMADGLETVAQRKRSLPRTRFCEIDQNLVSEQLNPQSTDECAVALADEPGESWLDGQGTSEALPNFGECTSLDIALRARYIDLGAEKLLGALSTTKGDKLDLSSDTPSTAAKADPASNTLTMAADIDWGLD